MLNPIILGALASLLVAGGVAAQSCTSYPNVLSNGSTADASQVTANFNCAALLGNARFTSSVGVNNSTIPTGAELSVTPTGSSWNEGIEINPSTANGYAGLSFRTTSNSITGSWEIFMANTTDGTGSHSLSIGMNGLTTMIGTGRVDTPFTISTSGVTRFGGNVGIQETPASNIPLDVAGIGRFESPNAGTTGAVIIRDAPGNPQAAVLQFVNNSNSAQLGYILGLSASGLDLSGGNIGVNTGSPSLNFFVNGTSGGTSAWSNSSDARLKKNVETISGALGLVERLRGVRFEWRPVAERQVGRTLDLPLGRRQTGFIAQEVEGVVPEAVEAPRKGSEDPYSMSEASLVPILVQALKEQQVEIEAQQADIRDLKARIAGLKPGR